MITCPACAQDFDPEAHPAVETLPQGLGTAEAYAGLSARCPACGAEVPPG